MITVLTFAKCERVGKTEGLVAAEFTFASASRKAGGETAKRPIGVRHCPPWRVCFFSHHLGGGGHGLIFNF
jgi:hypothetical protein